MPSIEDWNARGQGLLPGHLGVVVTAVGDRVAVNRGLSAT